MEPVGLTLFTTSRNSRLLLLLIKVMAVPLCPSRPALPTWMGRNGRENVVFCTFCNTFMTSSKTVDKPILFSNVLFPGNVKFKLNFCNKFTIYIILIDKLLM